MAEISVRPWVWFDGKAASFTVMGSGQITAKVPSGASSGPITVLTPAAVAWSPTNFLVTPTVKSFTPTSGPAGTDVTITGSAFTGATSVTLNGTPAKFRVKSYSKITTKVPAGATTGPIAVTTPSGTGTSAASFMVT